MSRNVVDAVIEFCKEKGLEDAFCFIPSYRQIDTPSGYVNDWSTAAFVDYVRERSSIAVMRDHAGVNQGSSRYSWWESLYADLDAGVDAIHVDPWKEMAGQRIPHHLASAMTVAIINACEATQAKGLIYEIGTEQAIHKYINGQELHAFLSEVQDQLGSEVWDRVKWVVVQSGSNVFDLDNSGNVTFGRERCRELVEACRSFGKRAKEHNADFLTIGSMAERMDVGVDAFNIAPELGTIETRAILQQLDEHDMHLERSELIHKCVQSDRWKRWVAVTGKGADRFALACGHYHFTDPWFVKIREALMRKTDINLIIRARLKERLEELVCLIE